MYYLSGTWNFLHSFTLHKWPTGFTYGQHEWSVFTEEGTTEQDTRNINKETQADFLP